jgi:hypothetical protein
MSALHPTTALAQEQARAGSVIKSNLLPLPHPLDRHRLEQRLDPQRRSRTPIKDGLYDVGREQRQPQETADIGIVDPLGPGDLGDAGVGAVFDETLPAVRPGDCLEEGVVDARVAAGEVDDPVRADDKLAPSSSVYLIIRELEAVSRGEVENLLIFMPPGSAKSTYVSVLFPSWHLANRPHDNILAATDSAEFAERRRVHNASCCIRPCSG